MLYEVSTPREYLDALDVDWRKDLLLELRDLIKDAAPDYAESIEYKMLGYSDSKGLVFCLNAQKNYVSLYVGDTTKVDPSSDLLKGLDIGKGCIRFRKSVDVAKTKIAQFIAEAVKKRAAGEDIDC